MACVGWILLIFSQCGIPRYSPIKIGLRPVTVALGAAPLGLLERRALPSAPFAVLDDLAVAVHFAHAAAFAAGRPLGPVAHAAVTTPLRHAPPAGGTTH